MLHKPFVMVRNGVRSLVSKISENKFVETPLPPKSQHAANVAAAIALEPSQPAPEPSAPAPRMKFLKIADGQSEVERLRSLAAALGRPQPEFQSHRAKDLNAEITRLDAVVAAGLAHPISSPPATSPKSEAIARPVVESAGAAGTPVKIMNKNNQSSADLRAELENKKEGIECVWGRGVSSSLLSRTIYGYTLTPEEDGIMEDDVKQAQHCAAAAERVADAYVKRAQKRSAAENSVEAMREDLGKLNRFLFNAGIPGDYSGLEVGPNEGPQRAAPKTREQACERWAAFMATINGEQSESRHADVVAAARRYVSRKSNRPYCLGMKASDTSSKPNPYRFSNIPKS